MTEGSTVLFFADSGWDAGNDVDSTAGTYNATNNHKGLVASPCAPGTTPLTCYGPNGAHGNAARDIADGAHVDVAVVDGLANVSRDASHRLLVQYTSNAASPCYYKTYNSANCLSDVRSNLGSVPGGGSTTVSVSLQNCAGGAPCPPDSPLTVAVSSPFQPSAGALFGIGQFTIRSSSTAQFVLSTSATPGPTPAPTCAGGAGC